MVINWINCELGSGPIPFRTQDWKHLDFLNIKDLIEKCLQYEPSNRINAKDALQHPWIIQAG